MCPSLEAMTAGWVAAQRQRTSDPDGPGRAGNLFHRSEGRPERPVFVWIGAEVQAPLPAGAAAPVHRNRSWRYLAATSDGIEHIDERTNGVEQIPADRLFHGSRKGSSG